MTAVDLQCWVVTDGTIGMEIQCLGLAEALGLAPVVKRIQPLLPWRWLPPHPWIASVAAAGPGGDRLAPPWPDLLIGSGRQAAGPAMAVRRAAAGRCFVVQIQDPRAAADNFDLLVVPGHDRARGANVVVTRGSLNRVTAARLADAAGRLAPRLAGLPRPLVAVMIGGTNARYRLTPALMRRIADDLATLAKREGASLLVTPSRRTGAANEAVLRDCLADTPGWVWDGTGENPYFGFLGAADALIVTGDSVNMTSEACSTGKPVFVIALEGDGGKFARFHADLEAIGCTRPFRGRLETWRYEPLAETRRVAEEVRRRLAARGVQLPAPVDLARTSP